MKKLVLLAMTHGAAVATGFALGIYFLPILTAPEAPQSSIVDAIAERARYTATFRRDLPGSDLLHWGEGEVSVGPREVTLKGALAPGPDYKLYLSAEHVETRDAFLAVKDRASVIGDVKTFENFIVEVPDGVDVDQFNTVVVWCESFSQFITSARYR